jgi:hypothetical protein
MTNAMQLATSCMALVIFAIFLIDLRRGRISRTLDVNSPPRWPRGLPFPFTCHGTSALATQKVSNQRVQLIWLFHDQWVSNIGHHHSLCPGYLLL